MRRVLDWYWPWALCMIIAMGTAWWEHHLLRWMAGAIGTAAAVALTQPARRLGRAAGARAAAAILRRRRGHA
jgi:hypothetical protein